LGIGRDLWNEIIKSHKVIFWRSKPDKFITHWYVKQCDGMHKTDKWIVYWIGIKPSEITTAIEYALSLEEDFE
jgi:acetylglutamate synthase